MCELIFIVYTTGPDRNDLAIARIPSVVYSDGDKAALEYADPKAAHAGASIKGIFFSLDDAADAIKSYAKR